MKIRRAFQWYKELFNSLSFDPLQSLSENLGIHRDFNFQNGNSLGSVRVHSLTLSYIPRSMRRDSQASSWPTTLQAIALVASPKLGLRQNGIGYKLVFHSYSKCASNTWYTLIFKFEKYKPNLKKLHGFEHVYSIGFYFISKLGKKIENKK